MVKAGVLKVLSVGCMMMMVLMGCAAVVAAGKDDEKVRVIVLFKDKVDKELVNKHGGSIITEFTLIPGVVTELTQEEMKELEKSDKVKAVEEDAEATIMGEVDEDGKGKPNQPPAPTAWGAAQINADDVWALGNTGSGVQVAVLDTGIDIDHLDLGIVYSGYDFINLDNNAEDDNGHGTHCAGIIAAMKNANSVTGVAPDVTLWAVKVLDSSGSGFISVIIDGINWVVEKNNNGGNIRIISMSLSSTFNSASLETACINAKASGIVIVAAAGNSGNTRAQYPAAYSSVISVGATDSSDAKAKWSSYGPNLDLMAPGVSILSTFIGDKYVSLSGTSMACPHVAGTVALVLASGAERANDFGNNDGDWSPDEVQDCLQQTATNLKTTGWDQYTGYGLVNALMAVVG